MGLPVKAVARSNLVVEMGQLRAVGKNFPQAAAVANYHNLLAVARNSRQVEAEPNRQAVVANSPRATHPRHPKAAAKAGGSGSLATPPRRPNPPKEREEMRTQARTRPAQAGAVAMAEGAKRRRVTPRLRLKERTKMSGNGAEEERQGEMKRRSQLKTRETPAKKRRVPALRRRRRINRQRTQARRRIQALRTESRIIQVLK